MTRSRQITLYFGTLLFFGGMGDPTGLVNLPVLFLLKERLHAGAEALAVFEALSFIPVYAAVLFGVLRDWWNPLGLRDRGYLAIAAPIAVACYSWLAFSPLTYTRLLAGVFAAMVAYQMMHCSWTALLAVVGNSQRGAGKLSALSETMETIVRLLSVLAGGWIVGHWQAKSIFLLAAAITLPIFLQSFWTPRAVFRDGESALGAHAPENLGGFLRSLALHGKTLWPVGVVLFLYNFSPGWYTPLFYYLTDVRHLNSETFGLCRGLQQGGMLISTIIYGRVCGRVELRRLLWFAIPVNIGVGFLYLVIGSPAAALAVSAVVGVFSGFATIAVFDLLRRCSPSGIEGSAVAAGYSAFGIAGSVGDLLGAVLYSHLGMAACLVADALATALILPLLGRLPREAMRSVDQETPSVA